MKTIKNPSFVQVRAMTLESLQLNSNTVNLLIQMVLRDSGDHALASLHGADRAKVYREFAVQFTVGTVMDVFDRLIEKHPGSHAGPSIFRFMSRLASLGISKIEWMQMPFNSLNGLSSRKLSREQWKKQSVLALEIFMDYRFVGELEEVFGISANQITIKQLLAWKKAGRDGLLERNRVKIRRKLKSLGFRYEDGPFMKQGTRREFEERLIWRHKLTRRAFGKIMEIAAAEKWQGFQFED